jgi:hypothetical protein
LLKIKQRASMKNETVSEIPLVCILKPTSRGQFLHKGHFSLPRPILPTRPISTWQFWASETLQKRSSNALVTLQNAPPAAYILSSCSPIMGSSMADGQSVVGTTGARASVPSSSRVQSLTPVSPPLLLGAPCLENIRKTGFGF